MRLSPHSGSGLLRRAEILDLVAHDARVGMGTQVAVAADEHARRVMVEIAVDAAERCPCLGTVASMPFDPVPKDTPSSVTQLAAAMAALGLYRGANTPAEHAAEARRLGGDAAYRLRLVNALLGAVQTEALLAEGLPVSTDDRLAAYEQQLSTAGVADSPTKRLRFLRWQALRVAGPLREITQHVEAGPIPLAAAWAAEGLQQLLDVIADSQHVASDSVKRLAASGTGELRTEAVTPARIGRASRRHDPPNHALRELWNAPVRGRASRRGQDPTAAAASQCSPPRPADGIPIREGRVPLLQSTYTSRLQPRPSLSPPCAVEHPMPPTPRSCGRCARR